MRKMAQDSNENDDIVLDADSGEERNQDEGTTTTTLAAKLKELRAKLSEATREASENLTGWQRAKADLVNSRRLAEEEREAAYGRGAAALAREVLPALDALEAAMQAPEWQSTSEAWRTGVERVARSLFQGLERAGVKSFGAAGEPFDPARHECMSVTPAPANETDHTIAQVLQSGYALKGVLVRPAKVIVFQYSESPPGESDSA